MANPTKKDLQNLLNGLCDNVYQTLNTMNKEQNVTDKMDEYDLATYDIGIENTIKTLYYIISQYISCKPQVITNLEEKQTKELKALKDRKVKMKKVSEEEKKDINKKIIEDKKINNKSKKKMSIIFN